MTRAQLEHILRAAGALTDGWRERLVRVSTPATQGVTGLCLAPEDLAAGKLAAGREKNLGFVTALLRHGLVETALLRTRVALLPTGYGSRAMAALARCEITKSRSADPRSA